MAESAFLRSVSASSPSAGYRLMPMLAVTVSARSAICIGERERIRQLACDRLDRGRSGFVLEQQRELVATETCKRVVGANP
jgi:hypothetical protein